MKIWNLLLNSLMIVILSINMNSVHADDDEWEHRSYPIKGPGSVQYRTECGSCHIAYPPRFLGKSSWQRLMSELDNHFGESAELERAERDAISLYLSKYGSSSRWYQFWKNNDKKSVPTRITETPAFRHEHDEIPFRLIENNTQIQSLSQCGSCHLNADKGSFNEHQIRIPGVGYWDDD